MNLTLSHRPPHEPDPSRPDLLTITEVAGILRWGEATVRRHIKDGVIPQAAIVRLPHRSRRTICRIKRAWLDTVLAGKATHQEPDRPTDAAS